MNVTVTGASGLIGSKLVERLRARGDEVTILSRNPPGPGAVRWLPEQEPAPRPRRSTAATPSSTSPARTSPSAGTTTPSGASAQLARARHAQPRGRHRGRRPAPGVLVSSSAVGYYGPHGDEEVDEQHAGRRRLPRRGVRGLGARGRSAPPSSGCASSCLRTGVVLDRGGGALAKMLPFFKLGVGGPGRRRRPVHAVDPPRRPRRAVPRGARRRGVAAARSTRPRPSR